MKLRLITIAALLLFSYSSSWADKVSAPEADNNPASVQSSPAASGPSTNFKPETCTASCNRSYDVCMDQQSSTRGEGGSLRNQNNLADNLIGSSSDCSDHLRSCLNSCGG